MEPIVMVRWGIAFSATLALRTLIALVDVMLYGLALQWRISSGTAGVLAG